jgi:hypothetical protein
VPSTLPVTSTLDDVSKPGTLRYAVAHAGDGDTIRFSPALHGAPIVLTQGELLLTHDVTIEPLKGGPQTISGNNLSRVFELAPGASVSLSNLTITGGDGWAGNTASSNDGLGGGILVDASASLALNGCTLSGDSAYTGGGIYNGGTATVTGCTLSGNTASFGLGGGGIYNAGTATVTDCTLSGNSTPYASGGAIENASPGILTVTGCTLSDNYAGPDRYGDGGAIGNGGYAYFSGVQLTGGTATVTGCVLSDNFAADGGGIYNFNGTVTVSGCNLSHNAAYQILGGGIGSFGRNGSLTVSDSTLSDNSAYEGGGICNGGTMTVTNCQLLNNSAWAGGGGIDNGGMATVTGCTLSGNSVGWVYGAGGGILNEGANDTVTVSGCTLSGNSAYLGGGIANGSYYFGPGTVTVSGSAFSANTTGDIYGPYTDLGGNTGL